ncbi:IS3 family transposase [Vreelandella sulfidaeris]
MRPWIHYCNHEHIKTKPRGLRPAQYRNQTLGG